MNRRLPFLALILGAAGLLPFLACGLLAVGPDDSAGAGRASFALVAYGGVILAFLGGVHWGFALQEPSGRGERARLGLGVLPSLVGWVALLLAIAVNTEAGIGLLLVGFIGTVMVESRAASVGLVTRSYLTLRYGLTGIVGVVLLLVLLLRIFGLHIKTF